MAERYSWVSKPIPSYVMSSVDARRSFAGQVKRVGFVRYAVKCGEYAEASYRRSSGAMSWGTGAFVDDVREKLFEFDNRTKVTRFSVPEIHEAGFWLPERDVVIRRIPPWEKSDEKWVEMPTRQYLRTIAPIARETVRQWRALGEEVA